MKKYILLFFMVIFSTVLRAENLKTVAVVNDVVITEYDLDNYSKIVKAHFKDIKDINNGIKKEILNGLIEEVLKGEAVKNEKITFDQDEFEYYLDSTSKGSEMEKNVKKYNIDKNMYLNILKNNYLWSKLIDLKIRSRVNISNSEVDDSLEYLTEKPLRTRYNISQITMYKNENVDPKNVMEKLYKEIKSDNNFDMIAKKFSQDNKENAGYIGWVDEMDINDEIYEAIKNLPVGTTTKPIYFGNSNSGYYMIIKLNDKKQEKIAKKDDLARVQYFLYNQKLSLEIKNYIDALYNNAFIEIYDLE